MGNLTDKDIKNIRKRKSYKEIADVLRFMLANPDKPEEVLRLAFPVYKYGTTPKMPRRPQWTDSESLEQVIKDYQDGKRQTEGTAG